MPRSGQIIPSWLHPHEAVYINDNTRYEDIAEQNNGTAFLHVFMSPKGVDNKVKYHNSVVNWVNEYGLPDYRRYGQAAYNAYVSLFTGLATSQSMRIMPENAVHANVIVLAKYKVADGKLVLAFDTASVKALTNAEDLDNYAEELTNLNEDGEGFKTVPIMYIWSRGRGVYGNDYRVRISHDKGADRENEYVNYIIELLSTENGTLSTLEAFNVSFYIDAIDPNSSLTMNVNEVIDDEEGKGSARFNMQVINDNLELIFGAYKEAFAQSQQGMPVKVVTTMPVADIADGDVYFVQGNFYAYDTSYAQFAIYEDAVELRPVESITVGEAEELVAYELPSGACKILKDGQLVDIVVNKADTLPIKAEANTIYNIGEDAYILNEHGTAMIPYAADEDEEDALLYTMKNWDVFGYNKFTESNDPNFEFVGGLKAVPILQTTGVGLSNGNDGDFADVNSVVYDFVVEDDELVAKPRVLTEAVRNAAIERAYIKAFQGGFDKTIQSKRRAPAELMLDACYPIAVKKAMVALTLKRGDCACHLDTKLINNVEDLDDFYNQIADLGHYTVSFDPHMMKTSDPITGKIIPVTMTLWESSKIPQHDATYGNHTPFAGEEYATISGHQKNSIRPIIDADDAETKEHLYADLHMNYIECIAENTFMRGAQQTSQNYWSDLSEENNVRVLLEIKRKIERLAAANRFKWSDPEEQRLFKESCEEIFSSYKGTKCRDLSIEVSSNSWETTRYITHVYLAVVFRTIQKRAIIEIDVNPRA